MRLVTKKTIVAGAMRHMTHKAVIIRCPTAIAAPVVPTPIVIAAGIPGRMDAHVTKDTISIAAVMALMTEYATVHRLFVIISGSIQLMAAYAVIATTGVWLMAQKTSGVLVGMAVTFVNFYRDDCSRKGIQHRSV